MNYTFDDDGHDPVHAYDMGGTVVLDMIDEEGRRVTMAISYAQAIAIGKIPQA